MSKLIIEGNAVYEIDEECMKKKREREERPKRKRKKEPPKDPETERAKEKGL